MIDERRLPGPADWTARAVAAHLGFPDAADFGRFFRNRTGFTPAAYTAQTEYRDNSSRPDTGPSL